MSDELFTSITAGTLISEFPDYLNEFMIRAFIEYLAKTQDEIKIEIMKAAKDDESEVDRIYRAVYDESYDEETSRDDWVREYAKCDHEESSLIEFNLSFAAFLCSQCIHELRKGGIDQAFQYLGNAKLCIGTARGLYGGAEQANLENERAKKMIYESIASIRHAGNRDQREKAIQHYKSNYSSFTSKDDAAFQMAEKIVPAKFATVRGWLKGISP